MAATKGLNVAIWNNATQITLQRNCSVRINGEPIDVTTKDDAIWKAYLMGHLEGEISMDGLLDVNGATHEALFTAISTQAALTLKFGHDATPTRYLTGSFFCTSVEHRAAHDGAAELSASFKLNGALTYTDA
jgi:TP901-1 family phage major tail protein